LVRDDYAGLTAQELPPFLRVGSMNVMHMGPNACRVTTYSPLDPLDIPQSVMAVLAYFDGRSTAASMAAIEKQVGVKISPKLVRKLADFEILVPAAEAPGD